MPWYYHVVGGIVKLLLRLLTRWRVEGGENVPRQGPLLVVANHLHLVDPPLLGVSLNRRLVFVAKEELFRSRLTAYLLRRLGAFPVRRGRPSRKALRQAEQFLDEGLAVVVFPEGARSHGGQLRPAFPGAVLMAVRNGVPVLPVGLTGTEKLKGPGWVLRRPGITVSIGCPFHLPPASGRLTRVELDRQADFVMRRIAGLLPVEYQGDYKT